MNTLNMALIAAAPNQPPNLTGGGVGAASGATLAGLIVAAWLVAKWKDHIKGDVRKYVIAAIIMTSCLAYGTGVLAQLVGTVNQTAGTVGTTLTSTTTGQ